MTLVPVDPSSEASVITLLERAAVWLAEAVHRGDAQDVALVKAQLATAAEATKQLGLSKEIQLDAQEMVRRAEYALGKAIRRGQAEGTVATREDNLRNVEVDHPDFDKPRPVTDFAPRGELYGSQRATGVLDLATAEPDDFEAAISEAKAEGNLSRANVARKASGEAAKTAPRKPLTDAARDAGWDLRKSVERLERIAADDRFNTHQAQMAPHLRSHLEHAIEVCTDLLGRINN
jgi:hypothetical protein